MENGKDVKILFKIAKTNSVHQSTRNHFTDNRDIESIKNKGGKIKNVSNSNRGMSFHRNHASPYNGIKFLNKTIFPSSIRNSISRWKTDLVAVYGFSDSQIKVAHFIKEIDKGNKVVTIADFNHAVGLVAIIYGKPEDASKNDIFEQMYNLSNDITSRNVNEAFITRKGKEYAELLTKWIGFLQGNIKKTDIFSYVNSKGGDEWQKRKVIDKLIIKNVSDNVNLESLSRFIYENDLFNCGSISEAILLLEGIDKRGGLSHNDLFGAFELIQKHFFRNSSKLGIDFFRANKIDIISSWNTPDPFCNEKILAVDLNKKPYIDNNRRQLNGKGVDEPITYSEIRYMSRKYHEDLDGITRLYLDEPNVEFARGINKDIWIKKAKSDFIATQASKAQIKT